MVLTCLAPTKNIRTAILSLSFVTGSLPKQEIEPGFLSSGTVINNMYRSDNI